MHLPRTKIKLNPIKKLTSFNCQELIPVGIFEVIPGATWNCDSKMIARLSTPKVPVMDDLFVDVYAFFVPWRLIWDDTKAFFGESSTAWWDQNANYEIPQLSYPLSRGSGLPEGFDVGSVADYLGLPIGVASYYTPSTDPGGPTPEALTNSQLPGRGYVLIWNKFFRDQNYMDEAYFPTDSTSVRGVPRGHYSIGSGGAVQKDYDYDPWLYAYRGSTPLPTSRPHDYFSDVFPEPQKGPEALIPASGDVLSLTDPKITRAGVAVTMSQSTNGAVYGNTTPGSVSNITAISDGNGVTLQSLMGNINDLRLAVAIQRYYEANSRGTRFNEFIRNHYGVDIGDARIQVPELLGHTKVRCGMTQVAQTSSTDNTSPQGNLAAYSLTADRGSFFNKTFVEPGYVYILATCRPARSYGQGVPALFRRRDLFDLYDPKFAYIGMTPVYKDEIYEDSTTANSGTRSVWGYKQAWSSYLDFPRTFTGYMRPQGSLSSIDLASLYYWHYGDSYGSEPTMSRDWLVSGTENVDRTLAVSSSLAHQIIFDMTLDVTMTAPIPLDRRPGLMDHF